jgi:hypothetical protein
VGPPEGDANDDPYRPLVIHLRGQPMSIVGPLEGAYCQRPPPAALLLHRAVATDIL